MVTDWKLIAVVGSVLVGILAILAILAVRGDITGAVVAGAASTVIGWFTGWIQPAPRTLAPPGSNGGKP